MHARIRLKLPNGSAQVVLPIIFANDTGSDLLTLFTEDMSVLATDPGFDDSLLFMHPVSTADGVNNR
jgi:hypothetical protein